jgi:hypothetical protein
MNPQPRRELLLADSGSNSQKPQNTGIRRRELEHSQALREL